jgi:hypothetical protein
MTKTGRVWPRRALTIVVVLAALYTALAAWAVPGRAADEPAVLQLRGAGSWGAYREMLPWQNALAESKSPIDLSYTAHGTVLGRESFLAGELDYMFSALPFSAAEGAKVPGGGGVIAAPVQVSSMAMVLQRPVPDGFTSVETICDPDDPDGPGPDCIVRKKYTKPVRVPNSNLAAMLLRYAGGVVPPMSSWNHADVLKAMGVDNFTTPPLAGPAPVLRSDMDEFNYFMQKYAATAAPSVWEGLKSQDRTIPWEPISERLGRTVSASRDGADQQAQQLGLGGGDPGSGTISQFTAGVLAPLPASAVGSVHDAFPDAKVEYMEVQNANGDWVAPSPDSLTKAVAAGGETPLYALTNKVPGAYPLTWVDSMYVPAKGLSQPKTEALATVIRYLATAGQAAAKPVGEGTLSPALTQKALAAANQVVESNCRGKVVTDTDPGPYAPDVPAMKNLGPVAHCTNEAKEGAPPPASGGETGGSFGSSDFSSGSTPVASAAETPQASGTSGGGSGEDRTATAALTASKLPMPFPASLGGLDQLATVLLGAALYLLLRKPVGRLLTRARPS